jgi:predicted transposase YbfD/YdcC
MPMPMPAQAYVTAASEDKNNRSRHERRTLRWVSADADTLCCVAARSVVEITREVEILKGRGKGKRTKESVLYGCTLDPDPARGKELLGKIRKYWGIEGGLHQRLDVSCWEDCSRVRNRNALLVLGMMRRSALGIYLHWWKHRKNKRQSTVKDFHDAMNRFNKKPNLLHHQRKLNFNPCKNLP